jgi:hypothetical protein
VLIKVLARGIVLAGVLVGTSTRCGPLSKSAVLVRDGVEDEAAASAHMFSFPWAVDPGILQNIKFLLQRSAPNLFFRDSQSIVMVKRNWKHSLRTTEKEKLESRDAPMSHVRTGW